MRIVRLCRAKYPDLDGRGAALNSGRWNSTGTPMVYASSCGALAVLEYRVHAKANPDDLLLYSIEVPDSIPMEKVAWIPDIHTAQRFGDVWVQTKRTLVLAVPSVVVPHQINYLLNPGHPGFKDSIRIVETLNFILDVRLLNLLPGHR